MTLKDRFLTQSAPDICPKLQKQAFGPNQSLKKLLQLAQMYIMVENQFSSVHLLSRVQIFATP